MRAVLDASAAVGVALKGQRVKTFLSVLADADVVLTPQLFVAEVANAFWKYCAGEHMPEQTAADGVEFCLSLSDEFIPLESLWREAFAEATIHKHPVYDMCYIVAARRHNAVLISADAKLNRLAVRMGVAVA
jgi:predicted nucleic acid-binding protein